MHYRQLIQCPADNCTNDEKDEKNPLYLMVSIMLRGDPKENRMVYEQHQAGGQAIIMMTLNNMCHLTDC